MIADPARVTKLVDVADLKSAAARRVGSTPTPGTMASAMRPPCAAGSCTASGLVKPIDHSAFGRLGAIEPGRE